MKTVHTMKRGFLSIIPVLLFLMACTSTKDIHQNPQKYAGKTVVLSGEITQRFPIPLSELRIYLFADDHGQVLVLSSKEHKVGDGLILKGRLAVLPEKRIASEMEDLIEEISDFIVENGWASKEGARNIAGGTVKVLTSVIRGLGKVFMVLESA